MLVILSSIATMAMYAETMLIPAIPDIIKDFQVSYSMSSWILTAYLVTGAVTTPIAGKLSDIYGKKKVLLIIMIIYAVGVFIGGFATNIYFLLSIRAIQGIGMSMFPIAFGIIRDQFPREKISIGQGVISSMFAAGAAIGLSIGAFIVQFFGWHATFFTIIPISILLLIVIWRFVHLDERESNKYQWSVNQSSTENVRSESSSLQTKKDSSRPDRRIDIKGAISLATAITSFLLILTLIETSSNNINTELPSTSSSLSSSSSIYQIGAFFAIAIISFILFVQIERKEKNPLVDLKLVLNKAILPANLIILIVGLSNFMVFQTIPILVRNPEPLGFGADAISTGSIQLPFALVFLIFGPTSGFIISKLGSLKPIIFGTIIITISFICLLLFHSTEIQVSINLGMLATGLSFAGVGAMNVIILATPGEYSGISLGIATLIRIIGSAIGPALAAMYMQMSQSILNINGVIRS
ncbi:MAG TPA: MFS transporter, partial [Nitrososphaeraceae archaeon]|nr:MFS transporter [Nitrososphaeraceae archaeon]